MDNAINTRASVVYNGCGQSRRVCSNAAEMSLSGVPSIYKEIYEEAYSQGETLTHVIHVRCDGAGSAQTVARSGGNLRIRDDLGKFTEGGLADFPLSYMDFRFYVDGGRSRTTAVCVKKDADGIDFTLTNLPEEFSVLTLLFQTRVNEFAPLAEGSRIETRAELYLCGNRVGDAYAFATVKSCPKIQIEKTVIPVPVENGNRLIYRFTLQNYGFASPSAMTLYDSFPFSGVFQPLEVTVNGMATSGYFYCRTNGDFAIGTAATPAFGLTVPAATPLKDAVTGTWQIIPGETVVTVTGRIAL